MDNKLRNIKALIAHSELKHKVIIGKMGVSRATFYSYLNGNQRLTFNFWEKLADILGVTYNTIYNMEDVANTYPAEIQEDVRYSEIKDMLIEELKKSNNRLETDLDDCKKQVRSWEKKNGRGPHPN